MMASTRGVLYLGVTNDPERRVFEHKNGTHAGFTKKYRCTKLVWHETYEYIYDALEREKEIKKWRREKKERLIDGINQFWEDLASEIFESSALLL